MDVRLCNALHGIVVYSLYMSGVRRVTSAAYELVRRSGQYALCTLCMVVGQGIALVIKNPNLTRGDKS
ncbi:hypothetical protein H0A71_01870 [Alcaligenaceae bacterium]|nr:hypothetical protein [Alcaligenaceae bacterium]